MKTTTTAGALGADDIGKRVRFTTRDGVVIEDELVAAFAVASSPDDYAEKDSATAGRPPLLYLHARHARPQEWRAVHAVGERGFRVDPLSRVQVWS